MGFNTKLVSASVEAGTSFRYFSQGSKPWCQTLSASWLRSRAKGKDFLTKGLEPLTWDSKARYLFVKAHLLGANRGYQTPGAVDRGNQAVTVLKQKFSQELKDRVLLLRGKFYKSERLDHSLVLKYIEYGCGPVMKATPTDEAKKVLKLSNEGGREAQLVAGQDDLSEQLLGLFRQPGTFWQIDRSGNPGHAMAGHNNGSMFTFFDPEAGEFRMSLGLLARWVKLAAVKDTVIGTKFATINRFYSLSQPQEQIARSLPPLPFSAADLQRQRISLRNVAKPQSQPLNYVPDGPDDRYAAPAPAQVQAPALVQVQVALAVDVVDDLLENGSDDDGVASMNAIDWDEIL